MTQEPELIGSLPIPDAPLHDCISNVQITSVKVRDKLKKLKRNRSSGPDGIHVNVLKEVLSLDKPLAFLFNQSLTEGYLPQDWRNANITPIHKGGARNQRDNYRPVSLTSQVVKVLERIILDDIWIHIDRTGLLSCEQHGFQRGSQQTPDVKKKTF